eukprot:2446211-Amphidinium_carterae.1
MHLPWNRGSLRREVLFESEAPKTRRKRCTAQRERPRMPCLFEGFRGAFNAGRLEINSRLDGFLWGIIFLGNGVQVNTRVPKAQKRQIFATQDPQSIRNSLSNPHRDRPPTNKEGSGPRLVFRFGGC